MGTSKYFEVFFGSGDWETSESDTPRPIATFPYQLSTLNGLELSFESLFTRCRRESNDLPQALPSLLCSTSDTRDRGDIEFLLLRINFDSCLDLRDAGCCRQLPMGGGVVTTTATISLPSCRVHWNRGVLQTILTTVFHTHRAPCPMPFS